MQLYTAPLFHKETRMKRYVALLRGINVGGKNKISMKDLTQYMQELGYVDVCTYLNSGNVIFSTQETDHLAMQETISMCIKDHLALEIPVLVIALEDLENKLQHAPEWWGNDDKSIYDNLICLFPDISYDFFYREVGDPNDAIEKVEHYDQVIFWSFSRKDYNKSTWWKKTASSEIASKITIRTANTIRNILKK